ncbi:MAG: DUF342 domain-containing protein [Desulfovibrionaceae bacterium]|nr:DUF342 domain-containing protein [Desulfovibrionaceae bacterium]
MRYYLIHYFDPDFDHLNRKPDADAVQKNGLDLLNLGYVQNVIKGQILAQIVPIDTLETPPNPRFILHSVDFPAGQNTFVHPNYPQYLLSAANGYVFYYEGRITVKSLLNVRQDISFNTGNVNFVGDMAVHGSVRSGFSILGNNVRIHGMLEGGIAHSNKNMIIDGGAKGATSDHCLIDTGGKLLASFLERIEARTRGNIVVNKYCLYCTVYAGNNMLVKEKLYGGSVNVFSSLYVGQQVGNRAEIPTNICLGYDPINIRRLEKLETFVAAISQRILHLKAIVGHLPPDANDKTLRLQRFIRQRANVLEASRLLAKKMAVDQKILNQCRLIVPGVIYPGVEISIGSFYFPVTKVYENVVFHLVDREIKVEPITATTMEQHPI